jgi:hypothetical protein
MQVTYQCMPFKNEARMDDLRLCHWVQCYKDAAGQTRPTDDGPYPFAKYNVLAGAVRYDDIEFETVIRRRFPESESGWSKVCNSTNTLKPSLLFRFYQSSTGVLGATWLGAIARPKQAGGSVASCQGRESTPRFLCSCGVTRHTIPALKALARLFLPRLACIMRNGALCMQSHHRCGRTIAQYWHAWFDRPAWRRKRRTTCWSSVRGSTCVSLSLLTAGTSRGGASARSRT